MYSYETTWIGYLTKLDAIEGMVHLSMVSIFCYHFLGHEIPMRFSILHLKKKQETARLQGMV